MSLDNLFEEILVTEQKALEKRQFLHSVKSEIIRCNEKLRDVTENLHKNKITLESKVKDLSEEYFHLDLLKKQEEGLKKQREEMVKENNIYLENLEEKKRKNTEERKTFVKEISEFNAAYDLLSNRIITIEVNAKSEIFDLETEAKYLQNDMKNMEQKNIQLNVLQQQKNELKGELLQLQNKLQGLEDEITRVAFNTKLLEPIPRVEDSPILTLEFRALKTCSSKTNTNQHKQIATRSQPVPGGSQHLLAWHVDPGTGRCTHHGNKAHEEFYARAWELGLCNASAH
ncbi:coiled-coil domain-containing protein 172 [Leucoraja erinacea]|uniref:coiled-coil domain-containing protein 172 n=1 Tax=Leucoraja erinaceus TaxID=7782 RepID=UPI0024569BB0|nr:coiled-coil domain-containing protein 172 [Leucoraja erinacea]